MCYSESYHFKNIRELKLGLISEEKCLAYMLQTKYGGSVKCPYCNTPNPIWLEAPLNKFKCRKGKCRRHFSAASGTIFKHKNIPMRLWFEALWLFFLDGGISSKSLRKQLHVNQKTAHRMLMKIRYAVSMHCFDLFFQGTVETDEMYLGPDPNKDLRVTKENSSNRKKVFQGILQQEMLDVNDEIILKRQLIIRLLGNHTDSANANKILPILRNYIYSGAEVMTDGSPIYNSLKRTHKWHFVIKHNYKKKIKKKDGSIGYVNRKYFARRDRIAGKIFRVVTTNGIENVWKHFRRMIATYIQFSYENAQLYADEFAYRYNMEKCELLEAFNELLKVCCKTAVTNKEIQKYTRVHETIFDKEGNILHISKRITLGESTRIAIDKYYDELRSRTYKKVS